MKGFLAKILIMAVMLLGLPLAGVALATLGSQYILSQGPAGRAVSGIPSPDTICESRALFVDRICRLRPCYAGRCLPLFHESDRRHPKAKGKEIVFLFLSMVGLARSCHRPSGMDPGLDPLSMVFRVSAPHLRASLAFFHPRYQCAHLSKKWALHDA